MTEEGGVQTFEIGINRVRELMWVVIIIGIITGYIFFRNQDIFWFYAVVVGSFSAVFTALYLFFRKLYVGLDETKQLHLPYGSGLPRKLKVENLDTIVTSVDQSGISKGVYIKSRMQNIAEVYPIDSLREWKKKELFEMKDRLASIKTSEKELIKSEKKKIRFMQSFMTRFAQKDENCVAIRFKRLHIAPTMKYAWDKAKLDFDQLKNVTIAVCVKHRDYFVTELQDMME
jgi:hypothetical protein